MAIEFIGRHMPNLYKSIVKPLTDRILNGVSNSYISLLSISAQFSESMQKAQEQERKVNKVASILGVGGKKKAEVAKIGDL